MSAMGGPGFEGSLYKDFVKSKLNKFEHVCVCGGGTVKLCTVRSKWNKFEHVREGRVPVQ